MATLQQTITNSLTKQTNEGVAAQEGGGLFSTSTEQLSKLASKNRLPSNPNNPLEAASFGANPEAAKMAGSSANLINTMRQSLRSDLRLDDDQRLTTEAPKTSEAAQGKREELEALGGLGSLRSRVANLTRNMIGQESTNLGNFQLRQGATSSFTNAAEEDLPILSASLENLAKGKATSQDILLLNQAMGRDQSNLMSTTELSNLFLQPAEQAAAQGVADSIGDQVMLRELSPEDLGELGFSSLEEMGERLGIEDPEELSNLTLEQLQQRVQEVEATEFSRTEELKRRAFDPYIGQAEREEARRQLREMGETGERVVEQDFESLASEVATASTIEFNGKEISVNDLLSDEYLTATVKQYLEDPEAAEKLKEEEPELASWIEAHQAALRETTSNIDSSVVEFKEVQDYNRSLGKLPDGSALGKEVMDVLTPGWDSLSTSKIESTPPLLGVLKDQTLPSADRQRLVAGLTSLAQTFPNSPILDELKGMDRNNLQRLGVLGNPRAMEHLNAYVEQQDLINNTNAATEPEYFLARLFGDEGKVKQAQDAIKQAAFLKNSGLVSGIDEGLMSVVDADGDGKMDAPEEIQARLRKLGETSLSDLLSKRGGSINDLSTIVGEANTLRSSIEQSMDSTWMKKLSAVTKDGNLTPKEIKGLNLTLGEAESLYKQITKGNLSPEVEWEARMKLGALKEAEKERYIGDGRTLGSASEYLRYNYDLNPGQLSHAQDLSKKISRAINTMPNSSAKQELIEFNSKLHTKINNSRIAAEKEAAKKKAAKEYPDISKGLGLGDMPLEEALNKFKSYEDYVKYYEEQAMKTAQKDPWGVMPDNVAHVLNALKERKSGNMFVQNVQYYLDNLGSLRRTK